MRGRGEEERRRNKEEEGREGGGVGGRGGEEEEQELLKSVPKPSTFLSTPLLPGMLWSKMSRFFSVEVLFLYCTLLCMYDLDK